MAQVDLTLLMQKDEWKLGEAFLLIDTSLLGMGDNYSETVEYLCDEAGITYDHDKEEEDEDYIDEMAKAAYTIIMIEDPTKILSGMAEYYNNSMEELHQQLSWSSTHTGKHPIVEALETIVDYVKPLGDAESLGKLEETLYYVSGTNFEVALLGKEIGYDFFRYLDSDYFYRSNDVYTVGSLTYRGHDEYCLGEYVIHASLRKGKDEGFTVVFNQFNDGIVASFYEYKRYFNPNSIAHKDLNYSICISDSNRSIISELIAEKINEFAKEKMEKAS